MSKALPQQRLLLELLMMSGQIAIPDDAEGTILWRTLSECKTNNWITVDHVSAGISSIQITNRGREILSTSE